MGLPFRETGLDVVGGGITYEKVVEVVHDDSINMILSTRIKCLYGGMKDELDMMKGENWDNESDWNLWMFSIED